MTNKKEEKETPPVEAVKNQKIWFDKLQEESRKPILVKIKEGAAPEGADYDLYNWMPYKDIWHKVKEPIWTRGILPNEICIDPDLKDWSRLATELKKIQAYCTKEGIPLELAYSGGNGIHGHIFFSAALKIDSNNFNDCKKYDIDLFKLVRNVLLDTILEGAGTNKLALALDSKKINFGVNRKGSQIREYGTLRKNGNYKTLITTIPNKKPEPGELPLVFPESVRLWTVPDKNNKIINDKIRKEISKAIEHNDFNIESINLRGNKLEKFPCLKTLLKSGATTGSRYYGSNSIALMGKQCGLSWTTTSEYIQLFFSRCDITEAEAKLRINNNKPMFESSDYHFSCRTVKEVFGEDICDFSRCPLLEKVKKIQAAALKKDEIPQHIKDRADQMLNEGKALEFLMATCSQFHVGDETTIRATFAAIANQSIENSNGIQPKVSGGSGKGKSHAIKAAFHLVPKEYVFETSLTAKALFHAHVKPGTIIFSDDADIGEDLEGIIKRCTTNFQDMTNHTLSIKDGNDWTSKTVTIPERIIWALTSVSDNGSLEYINRQFNLGVDETQDQDIKVWDFLRRKAKEGEKEFHVNDDVLVCREIIRDIKKHLFRVRIPYAERIQWSNPENRRNGAQFLDFIKAFAVFSYRLRAKTDDTIDANEDDFKGAVKLYGQRAPNQKLKLNDNEIAVLKLMTVNEQYTIEKLQQITGKPYHTIYRMFHGRDGKKSGLLEKVPGLTYKPETEFLGESEIRGEGEYEREYSTLKKTKPKHVYVLMVDFNSLLNFEIVAVLEPEIKS